MKVEKKCKVQWYLSPVPNVHPKIYGKDSHLKIASLRQKSPVKRNTYVNGISTSQPRDKVLGFQNFDCSHSHLNYNLKPLGETIQYYNLVLSKQTGTPTVLEWISINKELQVN